MEPDTAVSGGTKADQNPDTNAFGFTIMSGPDSEITSFDKRDGSHWELLDCVTDHEERQTVRAVCTDESAESNCGIIFKGRGVAETIVELPPQCGPGRYAMAVSLVPAEDWNHTSSPILSAGG